MKKFITLSLLALSALIVLTASYFISEGIASFFGIPKLTLPMTGILFLAALFGSSTKKIGALHDTPFTEGLCEKVQSSLIQLFGAKAPEVKRTQVGYLQAITSPQNMAGVTLVPIDPKNGKKKQVRLTLIQRGCEDDIVDTDNGNCSAEEFKSPFEETVDITQYIATKWMGFNEDDMRKLCEPDSQYRERVMNAEIDALMVSLNKKLITIQNANFGNFSPYSEVPAYDSCKDVTLLNAQGNGIDYSGEAEIIEDFKLLDTTSKPILVGAGKLSRYVTMAKVGCCNDLGINTSQAGAFDFYHDRYVESIIGADGFIGLVPGYVQLLTWNKYVGPYVKKSESFEKNTIVDPLTSLKLDFEWKYDDCTEQYIARFKLNYELFFLPAESFADCDELSGVNFTLCYTAKNAAA